MTPGPQIDILVEKLLALTQEGKVDWRDTADEDTFLAAFPKYVVTVRKSEDSFDSYGSKSEDSFDIRVADESGRTLEEATGGLNPRLRQNLRLLHEMARRRALHVDEALSDLLSSLSSI